MPSLILDFKKYKGKPLMLEKSEEKLQYIEKMIIFNKPPKEFIKIVIERNIELIIENSSKPIVLQKMNKMAFLQLFTKLLKKILNL